MKLLKIFALSAFLGSSSLAAQDTTQLSRYEFVPLNGEEPSVLGMVFDNATGCVARVYRTQEIDRDGFEVEGGQVVGIGDIKLGLSYEPWTCPRSASLSLRGNK